jgi:hypothetical protein
MGDRIQVFTTPPTSPQMAHGSPKSPSSSSPRPYHVYPLLPPALVGTHPRHPSSRPRATINYPLPPATLDLAYAQGKGTAKKVLLELADGSSFIGFSFGAAKSVSGELVFQTGLHPLTLYLLDFN